MEEGGLFAKMLNSGAEGFIGAIAIGTLYLVFLLVSDAVSFLKKKDRLQRLIIVGSLLGLAMTIYAPTQFVRNGQVLKRSYEFIFELKIGYGVALDILALQFIALILVGAFFHAIGKSSSNGDATKDTGPILEESNSNTRAPEPSSIDFETLSDQELVKRILDYGIRKLNGADKIQYSATVISMKKTKLSKTGREKLVDMCRRYLT